jgi:hypothetical protein
MAGLKLKFVEGFDLLPTSPLLTVTLLHKLFLFSCLEYFPSSLSFENHFFHAQEFILKTSSTPRSSY